MLTEGVACVVDIMARCGCYHRKESGGAVVRGGGVEASCDMAELRPWPARARRCKRKEEKGAKVRDSGWGDEGMEQRSGCSAFIPRRLGLGLPMAYSGWW
jgi:hypothetical protein